MTASTRNAIGIGHLLARTRTQLEAVRRAETDGEVPPLWPDEEPIDGPLDVMFERFAASPTERRVVGILLAHELCPRSRQILRDLTTELVADPTFDVVRRIVYGPLPTTIAWDELSHAGLLRRFGFIERTDGDDATPEHRQTFAIGRRTSALAHGRLELDHDVARYASLFDEPPPRASLIVGPDIDARVEAAVAGEPRRVIAYGRAGSGRRSLLATIARALGHRVLVVEGHGIDRDRDAARVQLRRVARECRLLDRVPLIRDLEVLADRLDILDEELPAFALATSTMQLVHRWRVAPVWIELPRLSGTARAGLWARALPAAADGDADLLSTLYPLSPSLIEAVGRAAVTACGDAEMQPCHVELGVRTVLDDRLAGLATRVSITQTWDDLVLPEDQATAIVELLARIRRRRTVYEDWGFATKVGKGLGVTALFSGPPGTGKTMCAGLIARELGTELYQVDLSKIASKWIGETEKNLANLFDAAEAGHAILLFDEADTLFGKRTTVQSSNDRHANQETNYLLQRLETYAGICVLTTNHEGAIDEAFRRRLSVHVRLPLPDIDERRRLWHALIPASAPRTDGLELDRLADKYAMTGGYIRNAVLRAAFLAADEESPISGKHLARAAQLEYESMGKLAVG